MAPPKFRPLPVSAPHAFSTKTLLPSPSQPQPCVSSSPVISPAALSLLQMLPAKTSRRINQSLRRFPDGPECRMRSPASHLTSPPPAGEQRSPCMPESRISRHEHRGDVVVGWELLQALPPSQTPQAPLLATRLSQGDKLLRFLPAASSHVSRSLTLRFPI